MPPTATLPSAADALTALNGYQAPDSATVLKQAQEQYGIPALSDKVSQLRGLTTNLTNAIQAVDPSVTGRTAGSLVTEGQRSALVNRERAPVVQQLGTANDSLNLASSDYKDASAKAESAAQGTLADSKAKYDRLLQTYQLANAREQAAQQAAVQAEERRQAQANADRQYALEAQRTNYATSGGGQSVDPAKEFLSYIATQFKNAGGQGNKNISRQQQDAWANSFFQQNGVSNANRQQYWDLFNKTYNRSSDPTKDWRYKR